MSHTNQGQNAVVCFTNILELLRSELPTKLQHNTDIHTVRGKTQQSETVYIRMIEEIFIKNNIFFHKASSQQPYDFRIPMKGYEDNQPSEQDIRNKNIVVDNEYKTLLLEIKKTSSNKIMCNDTLPTPFAFYIIIRTKNIPITSIDIQGTRGDLYIHPVMEKYIHKIYRMRTRCKKLDGEITMYPRCNFQWNIRDLFPTNH